MFVLFGALFACVSRADAVPPTTNDWFDVSFEALTPETAISVDSTTGISLGAGSWTSVPADGTAKIVADEDAGGVATCLSLNAPGEELTLTPATYGSPSDIETLSVQVKADAIDELPVLDGNVQGAFTVYLDGNDELSAQGWTADGWKALSSASVPVNGLTNFWVTVCLDFATKGGVRIVRYSVKPASGSLSVLSDANGDTWFTAATNATVVSSVSLSGIGSVRTINGDSLEVTGVATYNGVGYDTFEEAIAAAIADGFSAGAVTLLDDATWAPAATGAYQIDVNGHALAINGASGSWSGTTYTVTALTWWYWIGGASDAWADGSNWSHFAGGAAAGGYPNSGDDTAFFPSGASLTLNSYAKVRKIFTDGTLTLAGNGNGGIQTVANNNVAPLTIGGTGLVRLAGVNIIAPYATQSGNAKTEITNALEIVAGTTNVLRLATGSSRYSSIYVLGALSGSGTLIVRSNTDSGNYQAYFYGDASAFTGVFTDRLEGDDYAARVNIMASAALSSLATYNFTATYSNAGNNYILRAGGTGTTYRMGALNGEVHFDGNKNNASGANQYFGYTLEIGGKNENCSFGGTLARNGYPSYTKKVGTADMTFTGSQMPNITIENGTYIIGASTALPGSMIFTGGAFSVADGVTVNPAASFSSNSTAAVVFDDRGLDNTWTTLNDDRVPCGFTKKGAGTLTLTVAPTHRTKTTIEDGVLVVPQGTTIAALSLDGGRLTVPLTGAEDDTTVLNITALAEGTDYDALTNAVAIVGTTMSVESDGGSGYIVKATRNPQTFTWTGAADTAWENAANWTVGGVVASTAPLAIDTVAFPAGLGDKTNVVLSARATVAEVVADSDIALSGAQICSPMYRGEGALVLGDGAGFYVDGTTVVSNDLEIAGVVEVTPSTTYRTTRFYGDFTGCGTLTLGGERPNYELAGDNSGFAGTLVAPKDANDRNNITLSTATAASESASWTVYSSGGSNDGFLHFDSQTVKFGSLSGNLYFNKMGYAKNVLEIGALGNDMSLGGSFCYSEGKDGNGNWRVRGSGNDIRKVGVGNLTLTATRVRNVFLKDGVVTLAHGTNSVHQETRYTFEGGTMAITGKYDDGEKVDFCDPSALIVDSASSICFSNDVGEVHTWSTALAASNVGGLTKKGAGTLTLSAAPLYTGTTRVEDGKLVVNGALSGTSEIVVDDPAAAMAAGTWYIAAESMRRPKLVSAAPDADKYKFVRSTTIIGDKTYTCYVVGEALPPLVLIMQ